MNAATIPHGCTGLFSYRLATVEDLVAFLQAGDVINTIAYQETLDWVAALTGQTFTVSRDAHALQPGDEAFVIRRTTRLANTWKPRKPLDPALIELGLLRCESPPLPAKKRASRARKRA
jgi:hypothetical protein